jgi:surface antigen
VTNDYPAKWRDAAQDNVIDDWGYYNRECTSWVAWRLSSRNGFTMPRAIGHANMWDDALGRLGYRIDNIPSVGSIAQTDAGQYGHVAWTSALGNSTVTIEEYNFRISSAYPPGSWGSRTVPVSAFRYIHVKDLPPL